MEKEKNFFFFFSLVIILQFLVVVVIKINVSFDSFHDLRLKYSVFSESFATCSDKCQDVKFKTHTLKLTTVDILI